MIKKVLIVTDFYNPHKSGITTYIDYMIDTIKNKGHKITILTTLHEHDLKKNEIINDIEIIRCKPTIKLSRGFYSIDLVFKFIKIYKNFNLVNIHYPLVEIFPIIFLTNKSKTIINYHCLPYFSFYAKFITFYFYMFGLFSILKSKKIITLSNDYQESIPLHKYFNKKIYEIPPYISISSHGFNSKTNNTRITIGYLGRLSNEKGLEYLIDASNKLEENEIDHKLIIAGDNTDTRFQKYIQRLQNISNKNVYFLGKINEKEKKEFYQNLDIFILPSINSLEAFGIVQLEAMSFGIQVIASNIYGVRSIINNTKNGYLFKNKNTDDLYKKILICKKKPIPSHKVKQNVITYYNKEKFEKNILKLFS